MPADRVYRARRQERVRNLESRNAKEGVLSAPTRDPGLDKPIKRRHHAWRCTRYGALHPLRSAAPDQNGCNAYGLGAMPMDRVYRARRQERLRNLESRNAKEGVLSTPTRDPGLGRLIKRRRHAGRCTRCGALHQFRGSAPVAGRCTRCGALHPIRSGAMPTDWVQCLRIGCTALAGKNACGTWNPATRKKAS